MIILLINDLGIKLWQAIENHWTKSGQDGRHKWNTEEAEGATHAHWGVLVGGIDLLHTSSFSYYANKRRKKYGADQYLWLPPMEKGDLPNWEVINFQNPDTPDSRKGFFVNGKENIGFPNHVMLHTSWVNSNKYEGVEMTWRELFQTPNKRQYTWLPARWEPLTSA